jgi:hypothetical protein
MIPSGQHLMFPLYLVILAADLAPGAAPPVSSPEARALAYLAREVPAWSKANRCYSCHHNGDAARALYTAVRLGHVLPPGALADTTAWLERPQSWDHNGGEGPFSDKKLADLQFAAALAEARQAGLVRDRRVLERAAGRVLAWQGKDGAWRVVAAGTIGSPATHGTILATHLARRTLRLLDADGSREALAKSDRWLRETKVDSVLDAAGMLLALGGASDAEAVGQKRRCAELIGKGESRGGGWGPYVNSPAEVFDTAVVLLALVEQEPRPEVKGWIRRGRNYLLGQQQKDGSWIETTRPSGAESFAQRLSTSGWATLALLEVGRASQPGPGRPSQALQPGK